MARTEKPQSEVLVIEPEPLSRQYVVQALQNLALLLHVKTSFSEIQGQRSSTGTRLVILGLDVDAGDNLSRLEQAQKHCPGAVIMGICPRVEPAARIALLDAGLDFIIEKPFFVEECVSAVQAILRRLEQHQTYLLKPASEVGDLDEA